MWRTSRSELRYTSRRYFGLVEKGVLSPEDRIELLEGIIVSMAPQSPRHAAATGRIEDALRTAVGKRVLVGGRRPLLLGEYSVAEPDVMLLPGDVADYDTAHPTVALLVVEVADTSIAQDRLTKTIIYAEGGIPEYWLVNLRDECVEVSRGPDPAGRRYGQHQIFQRGERIEIAVFPGVFVAVDDLLPSPGSAAQSPPGDE